MRLDRDAALWALIDAARLPLVTGLVMVLAVLTWAAIVVTRWQLRRRALAAARSPVVTMSAVEVSPDQVGGVPGCLACGGTGTVLRAIGSGRYQPGACPMCEPISRAA